MSTPPIAVTGPTEAAQPPAAATASPPLPVNAGATHGVGNCVSVTVHVSPNGAVTMPTPDPGNVIVTGVGPVVPPGPVHDTLNVYVPGIIAAPVFLRISKRTGSCGLSQFSMLRTVTTVVLLAVIATGWVGEITVVHDAVAPRHAFRPGIGARAASVTVHWFGATIPVTVVPTEPGATAMVGLGMAGVQLTVIVNVAGIGAGPPVLFDTDLITRSEPVVGLSHTSVFVMMVPVVCAICTVSGPGLLATHDAVPLGQALTFSTCGGSVSEMVQTVPPGICPAGGTVTVPLTATVTGTGVMPEQLATMLKLGGVGTLSVLTTLLWICSVPPVGGLQSSLFVTVRTTVWPATIVTGGEYVTVHVAPRPLHASSAAMFGGGTSVTEQIVPAASVPGCGIVWPPGTATGVLTLGEAALAEQCVVVLKVAGIGAVGPTLLMTILRTLRDPVLIGGTQLIVTLSTCGPAMPVSADANASVVDGAAEVKVKLCCSHFPSVGLIPATL